MARVNADTPKRILISDPEFNFHTYLINNSEKASAHPFYVTVNIQKDGHNTMNDIV